MNLYDYLENKYLEEFEDDFKSFDEFVQTFFRTNLYLDGCTYRELLTVDEDVMDEVRMSYRLDKEKRSIQIMVL
ncbi:hypothetical protein FC961_12120 [Clostridium botulinum]|nr:hypothetical protein [Clostridium botulinum]NFO92664.1 hypothetical protein [Clostridium botulinum]